MTSTYPDNPYGILCQNITLRPRQNGRHFADDTFKRIFLRENVRISIKISLNFVPKSPIDDIPALFQMMAWRQPGDTPLSEAMMVSLLTFICVARPRWDIGRFNNSFTHYVYTQTRIYDTLQASSLYTNFRKRPTSKYQQSRTTKYWCPEQSCLVVWWYLARVCLILSIT